MFHSDCYYAGNRTYAGCDGHYVRLNEIDSGYFTHHLSAWILGMIKELDTLKTKYADLQDVHNLALSYMELAGHNGAAAFHSESSFEDSGLSSKWENVKDAFEATLEGENPPECFSPEISPESLFKSFE